MFANCPPFLLADELRILEPRAAILLGRGRLREEARRPLVPGPGYGREEGPHLERNIAELDGRSFTLFCLNHPSSRAADFEASLLQLVNSLNSEPLR
jgi:hypothetical protein